VQDLVPETSENLHMGTELVPETRKTTSWRDCLPEKISLNSVVAKAARPKTNGSLSHTNATPIRDQDQRLNHVCALIRD